MEHFKPTMTTAANFINQAALGSAMTPVFGPQARHFWEAQESILSEADTFSRHWFERRHTAATTALEAAKTITQNGAADPGAAMKTIADWQTHSAQRIAEDFQDWMALFSRCATHMANYETKSVEDVMEKAAETIDSSTKSKHKQ